jgi:hypothetical protein
MPFDFNTLRLVPNKSFNLKSLITHPWLLMAGSIGGMLLALIKFSYNWVDWFGVYNRPLIEYQPQKSIAS